MNGRKVRELDLAHERQLQRVPVADMVDDIDFVLEVARLAAGLKRGESHHLWSSRE